MLDALIERPKLEVVWKGKSYWRIFNVYIYIYSLSSCSLCVIRRGGQGETKPICHNPHTQHFRAFITVTAFMREDENVEATGLHVPPTIINLSKDLVVNEGSNVTLMCQASGKPEPSLTWKLLSPSVDLVSEDEYLDIPSISRQRAGTYECTAINDIATDVQTVEITVNYAPSVSEGRDVGVTLGQRGVLECEVDAVPKADFEWYRDDRRIFNGLDGMEIEDAGQLSKLTFLNISEADYGNYTCIAINKLGSSNASFVLYGPGAVQDGNSGSMGTHVHTYTCLLLVILLPFLLKF
uniref:Neurotrimin n=1 Tax=Oncorhynchus mykiss TaxID=8022 RepID=A0A8K9UYQ8_ONCMY